MPQQAPGLSLGEIVARLGGALTGDAALRVDRVATLESASPGTISFLANPKYEARLRATRAGAVIVAPRNAAACPVAHIVADDPYVYYARVAQLLAPVLRPASGVHASAVVASPLPASACVGACAVIEEDAEIGEGVVVGPGCVIGRGAHIGADSLLHAGVKIYAGCRIGARAIIHSGAVIGADGFGFAREKDGSWVKIPQTGRVIIGDDVEIGANTTIDRGALDDTVIEDGVKLDNQIQVAHNVRIGAHSIIAGCVGIAGSARIGRRCMLGGAAMIIGHATIADDVTVTGGTYIGKSVMKSGTTYTSSMPLLEHGEWLKNFAQIRNLDRMAERIRVLEQRLAELEKKG